MSAEPPEAPTTEATDGRPEPVPSSEHPPPRRPGERVFAVLLVGLSAVALWQSALISDVEGPAVRRLTSPGVFPMLASAVMLVSALAVLRDVLRRSREAPPEELATEARGRRRLRRALADVLPRRLVVVTALIALYVASMPWLGFVAGSGAFLLAAFLYLWRRPWWVSLALAVVSLALVWAVFRLLFEVVLPQGELARVLRGFL